MCLANKGVLVWGRSPRHVRFVLSILGELGAPQGGIISVRILGLASESHHQLNGDRHAKASQKWFDTGESNGIAGMSRSIFLYLEHVTTQL